MAWNGSTNVGGTTPAPKKPAKKSPGLMHGLIAGAAIVLIGVISLYFVTSEPDESTVEKKGPTQIAEVEPEIAAATEARENVKKQFFEMTNDEKLNSIRKKYGNNIPKNLQPTVYYLEHPTKVEYHPARTKYDIFTRRCDQEIASLVTTTPGTWFMRKPTFDTDFDKDFANSVAEKIEILDTDTEEQKEMKQAVIDAKKELAKILKDTGETPSSVMNREAEALYALGEYQRSLEDELHAVKMNPDYSDQDLIDFVSAANQMLEQKGAGKIAMPNLTYRHVSLRSAAIREAEKAAARLEK